MKKHTLELEDAFEGFLKTKPYSFASKTDSQSNERVYYMTKADDVPLEFSAILGDALHNLRSTLDHLAYHLVLIGGGSEKQLRSSQFPVYETRDKYQANRDFRTEGMRPDAKKAIDEIQPYTGGVGEYLWHLTILNNIDKHRFLPTVWSSFRGHSALPSDREFLAKFHGGKPSDYTNDSMISDPKIAGRGLKVGDEVLRIPTSESEPDMKFLVNIAFGEPEIVKGNPVTDTLLAMGHYVRRIIFDFDARGLLV